MRLLFVVQRYGPEIAGGAELACREYAARLARRGHQVEVLTSCALSYVDWADHFPAGSSPVDGLTLHRLPVVEPRCDALFGRLNARVPWGTDRVPLHLQERWIQAAGPRLAGMEQWLAGRAGDFDAVVFFTYLYWTTWAGLPVAAGLAPTVLHPTAHDEPPLYLGLFDTTFRQADALGFLTEEERALVERRFGMRRPAAVIGLGTEPEVGDPADEAIFRDAHGLGDRPYLLCLGRVDAAKGSEELFDFFAAYKRRNPGPLALAMVGDPARPLPAHADVFVTGAVGEDIKRSALAGALLLVQPSYFESFSLVLVEAWAAGKAALVQGHCAVLAGQARRSGGGAPYRGFAEFEAALDRLAADPGLCRTLGEAGRRYVEVHCEWSAIIRRYEQFLDTTRARCRPPR